MTEASAPRRSRSRRALVAHHGRAAGARDRRARRRRASSSASAARAREAAESALYAVLGRGLPADGGVRRRAAAACGACARFGALQLAIDVALVTAARALLRRRGQLLRLPLPPDHALRGASSSSGAAPTARRCSRRRATASRSGRRSARARGRSSAGRCRARRSRRSGWCTRRRCCWWRCSATALARELRIAGERLERERQQPPRLRDLHERTVESLTSGLLDHGSRRAASPRSTPRRSASRGAQRADVLGLDVEEVLPGARELVMAPRATARAAAGAHGVPRPSRARSAASGSRAASCAPRTASPAAGS